MKVRSIGEWSWNWVWASMAIYVAAAVTIGWLAGHLLSGGYLSHPLHMQIQVFSMLCSYAIGGFTVALFSPKVRIAEPAVGAFLAVTATFAYSFFTPVVFVQFSATRVVLGGALAMICAAFGAKCGERLAAQLGDDDSQRWRRRHR